MDSGLTEQEQQKVLELKMAATRCPQCGRTKSAQAGLCRPCSTTRQFDKRYLEWRNAVLQEDKHTCQVCGKHDSTGATLQAHHIENYRRQSHLRFVVGNGICLCRKCHDDFHGRFGRWGNNWHQVKEFISDERYRRQH